MLGPADEEPLALLNDLVAIYDAGRREPLPLPLKTSFAWASARHQADQPPVEAALKKWKSGMYPAEDAEPAHERVWGERAPLERLLGPVPAGEETEGEDHPARRPRRAAVAAAAPLRTERGCDGALRPPRPAAAGASTIVLEASAGTGKTFTLAGLVTRYVAEGEATLDEMLLITFGRAASQELRERVRGQLVEAARALDDPTVGDNELLAAPGQGQRRGARRAAAPPARRARRLRRRHDRDDPPVLPAGAALLGVAGDTDAGVTLVESLDELVTEIVDDLYLRGFGDSRSTPPLTRARGARARPRGSSPTRTRC